MPLSSSGGGGGAGLPGGNIIDRWNGADLTQFEGSVAFQHTNWATTLTLVANTAAPYGQVIRLGSSAGNVPGGAIWLAASALTFAGTSRRFSLDILVMGLDQNYAGVAFCCDNDGTFHGLCDTNGAAPFQFRVDADTYDEGNQIGGNLYGLVNEAWVKYDFIVEKPASAPPRGIATGHSVTHNSTIGKTWDMLEPNWGAFPATWNSRLCNRWGLGIQAPGGSAPAQFDVGDFILRSYE